MTAFVRLGRSVVIAGTGGRIGLGVTVEHDNALQFVLVGVEPENQYYVFPAVSPMQS